MRTVDRVKLWLVFFSMAAVAFGSLSTLALDTNGRSTINDAACSMMLVGLLLVGAIARRRMSRS